MKRSWEIQPLGAFMVINRVPRLATWRQPRAPAEKALQEIRVVRTRLALPEREDVNASQHEGHRAEAKAEPRRMNLLAEEDQRKADAQEKPGQNEENVNSLNAPQLSIAVVSSVGMTMDLLIFRLRWSASRRPGRARRR
jgi:hypothetical protein